jgi:hypothetical protein
MVDKSVEAYLERITGYVGDRDPIGILKRTPRTLERQISGVSRRRLAAPPAPGKWSAGQILAHLSELELVWGYRIRMIVEQPAVAIAGMDPDAWARNSDYARLDPRASLETFRALRRANLELLESLPPRALRRYGLHAQFGRLTVARIATLLAGHDLNHTRQVVAILRGRRAARGNR